VKDPGSEAGVAMQFRLQPADAELKPMYYPAADVQIQVRLLPVLRKYK
jgi:hypothetical protein